MRYFFYDGDRIIAEREENTWVIRHLVSLSPRHPVGFVSGGVRIYHSDRLGSVRFVTDASQNILVSYVYEGFGKVIGQNGGGGGPYQFCGLFGYRNDYDASLLHVGARYYEPEIGLWVQKDLWLGNISIPLTLNRYVYCINNPMNHLDPTGLIICPVGCSCPQCLWGLLGDILMAAGIVITAVGTVISLISPVGGGVAAGGAGLFLIGFVVNIIEEEILHAPGGPHP